MMLYELVNETPVFKMRNAVTAVSVNEAIPKIIETAMIIKKSMSFFKFDIN